MDSTLCRVTSRQLAESVGGLLFVVAALKGVDPKGEIVIRLAAVSGDWEHSDATESHLRERTGTLLRFLLSELEAHP